MLALTPNRSGGSQRGFSGRRENPPTAGARPFPPYRTPRELPATQCSRLAIGVRIENVCSMPCSPLRGGNQGSPCALARCGGGVSPQHAVPAWGRSSHRRFLWLRSPERLVPVVPFLAGTGPSLPCCPSFATTPEARLASHPEARQDLIQEVVASAYFEPFLALFFPTPMPRSTGAAAAIPSNRELRQIVREGELGRRRVDHLVKVWLTSGQEQWVLVHVEVQTAEDPDFARRMYTYNYRLFDRYNREVANLGRGRGAAPVSRDRLDDRFAEAAGSELPATDQTA